MYSIGVDIGAHKRVSARSESGKCENFQTLATDNKSNDSELLKQVLEMIELQLKEDSPEQITIAMPGPTDGETIFRLPNFSNIPKRIKFQKLVEKALRKKGIDSKVVLINDAVAAAFAEWKYGAGKGINDFCFLCIGSGIGGCSVIEGKVYRGAHARAGEVGHNYVVDPRSNEARLCGCGDHGHAEAHASGTAIELIALERRDLEGWGLLLSRSKKIERGALEKELRCIDKGIISARGVFLAAEKLHDPIAKEIVYEGTYQLSSLILDIICILDPELIIIGGGLGADMLPYVKKEIKNRGFESGGSYKIKVASLGRNAGVIGASLWQA
jgi:glucokinase